MRRNRTPGGHKVQLRRLQALFVLGLSLASLRAQVLPPPPARPEVNRLSTEARLFVRAYHFYGNSVFSDTELAKVTEPFTNREISSEELEQARRAITLHYVNHGYVNSGALIPDQNPANGIIVIRIVEGVLSGIDLHGNKWLRDGYLHSRLQRWSTSPLNLNQLQEGLQLLRQNPNVRQINAELKPGNAPGEAMLDARVVDEQPFRLGLQIDNQRPPSVGAYQIWLLASDLNLTGHSDPLELRYGIANSSADGFEFSGADNMEGSYVLPLNRYDTTLGLHASRLNTAIVEDPFTDLNIESLTTSYGVVLRQPVYQTANQEAAVSIGLDRRWNKTWLLDEPFNISPGAIHGESEVWVLRLSQEWLQRGQNHVLALRSTFNFGLDVFDATDDRIAGHPDGNYFSWLGQGQYVQRLFNTQNELILRVTGQWTAEPLLALEQLSVGGFESVRGYRENQLVRDRGIISSAEFRLPVLFDKRGAGIVHLAPFFDFGGGWDVRGSSSPTTLYSTGLGLLLAPNKHISASLYWGYRLRHVDKPDDEDPQDLGLHFKINIHAF
jgi:hemolysin activation/secretion protein